MEVNPKSAKLNISELVLYKMYRKTKVSTKKVKMWGWHKKAQEQVDALTEALAMDCTCKYVAQFLYI